MLLQVAPDGYQAVLDKTVRLDCCMSFAAEGVPDAPAPCYIVAQYNLMIPLKSLHWWVQQVQLHQLPLGAAVNALEDFCRRHPAAAALDAQRANLVLTQHSRMLSWVGNILRPLCATYAQHRHKPPDGEPEQECTTMVYKQLKHTYRDVAEAAATAGALCEQVVRLQRKLGLYAAPRSAVADAAAENMQASFAPFHLQCIEAVRNKLIAFECEMHRQLIADIESSKRKRE
jgi:hypothetical protein